MTKRYTFWRSTTGAPCVNPDSEFAPRLILNGLGLGATINKDNKPQWKGFRYHDLLIALRASCVILDRNQAELNSIDAGLIVKTGMANVIRSKGGNCHIHPREVIEQADIEASKFFRKPFSDYSLITSLSINKFPCRRIKIGDSIVTPLKSRGKKYAISDDVHLTLCDHPYRNHIEKTQYQHIQIKTQGRTIHEGADKAIETLNLLQGYWNLVATYGTSVISFGLAKKKSLAVIRRGPIHTLHNKEGELVENMIWYELDYAGDAELFAPESDWARIEINRKWLMRKVAQLPYRHKLEQFIALYAIALEQNDLDLAMIQMWSLLEKITNTLNARYDETVKRAAWIFQEHALMKEKLHILRHKRNRFVHAAKSDIDREDIAYSIKSIIEQHLLHLIRNDLKVTSVEEYGNHLALPTSIEIIENKRRRLDIARSLLLQHNKRQ